VAYFHKEDVELAALRERIYEAGTSDSLTVVTESIEKELVILRQRSQDRKKNEHLHQEEGVAAEKNRIGAEIRLHTERKDQIIKTLGRLEGEKTFLEKELAKDREVTEATIPLTDLRAAHGTLINGITSLKRALEVSDIAKATESVGGLHTATETFFGAYKEGDATKKETLQKSIEVLVDTISKHEETLSTLIKEITVLENSLQTLSHQAEETIITRHEEEKKVMLLESKLRELESTIQLRKQEESELSLRTEHYEALKNEGVMIVGRIILDYKNAVPDPKYKETRKPDLMRAIERSKLRIEEAGVPNRDEIISEYKTTKERDEYLTKELTDIKETESKLLVLIKELESTLALRFTTGVEEVSKVFSSFFAEVFIGGKAKLSLVKSVKIDDEGNEITEQGIDLDVSLPNKKVKEIGMFSGGERALVSIALLFAMSQVTPPPFMVLDETDAPLDESNARKYGAMLKRLSENSKLLVITHNRETMNHCDMLYGVTIGVDGGSKLLSINFKEAEKLAE
jgi:chromosome segregation protein